MMLFENFLGFTSIDFFSSVDLSLKNYCCGTEESWGEGFE